MFNVVINTIIRETVFVMAKRFNGLWHYYLFFWHVQETTSFKATNHSKLVIWNDFCIEFFDYQVISLTCFLYLTGFYVGTWKEDIVLGYNNNLCYNLLAPVFRILNNWEVKITHWHIPYIKTDLLRRYLSKREPA